MEALAGRTAANRATASVAAPGRAVLAMPTAMAATTSRHQPAVETVGITLEV